MAYQKQNFFDGGVLNAAHLNNIENGIVQNENDIKNKADLVGGKVPETQLPELGIKQEQLEGAVNEALQAAKESGEFDGAPGADGTSITITDVQSSELDGGDNVISFSDGNTITIKNGNKGEDGFAPTVEVTEIEGGHQVKITDANGPPQTFDVMDGKDGNGGTNDLSAYLTEEEAEQTYQPKGDYITEEEANQLYQPKGDYLTEHQKLKTINGQSLIGEGNITIEGGDTSVQSEYVNVKYLESTGTQYIDTGYVVQEDDTIEVDYEIPSESLSEKRDKLIIDARDATSAIRVSTWGDNYKWYVRFGNADGVTSTAITSSLKGVFSISKNTFILNGEVVFDDLQYTAMPTGTLALFSGRAFDTGAMSGPAYVKISNVKIKRNGETIRNFRPVQRIADGELGMRDAVTGEFYVNAGTGVFSYAPADFVEPSVVQKKPTLTEEQKLALQALMDDYYNNSSTTFYYEFTHNRNAFTAGATCYNSTKGKFKQCCATFVQNIMMGRSVNDFVGKNASTYSANITKTDVSDFGYYFDFKYRKYLYGLTDTDENGNTVYYGYNQPNADNYEGSYSYNSYYHPDSKETNMQNFNGFCNANDMARELYEMGCEIPFSELDVGDIIFTLDNDLSDNSSMFNFHAWRNIYHVGMVYDVKQIDASSKEIYYIECTSYFDVDNRPIEKPFLSSSQMDLRFKAFKLTEDMAFCARMPVAFGYEPNVPSKITASAKP